MLRRVLPLGRKLHVGIVGGGVAGMRCAEVLLEQGVHVTILEARDRLGGRLGQGTLNGQFRVDLGPNWIHGTVDNPMLDLAKETGTVTSEWGEHQTYIDSDKSVLSVEEARYAGEFAWETITEAFQKSNERFGSSDGEDISPEKSLADFFNDKIARMCNDGRPGTEARAILLKKVSRFFGPFTGQPVEEQSLKFFWLEECLEGENLYCADSYFKILQRLARPVKLGATIHYNRAVQLIRSRNDTLEGRFLPSLTHAACSNRSDQASTGTEETEFDEIVVTTPLGWLKQHGDAFEPPLPERISTAVEALGYGTLDKVYVAFGDAWWNQPLTRDVSIPPVEAQQSGPNVTATTAPTHQTSADVTTSDKLLAEDPNYPGFTTFLYPEYAKDTNPTLQNQEICNLAALPGSTAQPTLLFYIYGDFAKAIANVVGSLPHRAPDAQASEAYIAALWPYFEPYISQLPNYTAGSSSCRAVDMLATAWANDEFAGNGSYTNFPVGLERGDEDVRVLREGLPDGGIWFAGEHTAPFVALGTVTGAYWSGEAVAGRILGAYGLGDEQTSNDHANADVRA